MAKLKKKKDPFADREAAKYEKPIPSREYILQWLADRGRPATYPQLIEELGLKTAEDEEALRRRLIAMTRDGQLLKNRKGGYGPLEKMELLAGRVIGHKDGFGFVEPEGEEEDLFLSPRQMRMVFHGDRVLVRVADIDSRGRKEAVIVEVLERNTQQLVGRLNIESGAAFLEPTNKKITQNILIPTDSLNGAEHGQMVVIALLGQPTKESPPIGQVVEVLGEHMAPGMEITVAIHNHGLPFEWPEDVLQEAQKFPPTVSDEMIAGREDFRHLPFVTIDGEDAKDFDDAIYCVPRSKGGWLLSVAIADVSAYVTPNSPLDREAFVRGNSVYFPGRVIPMLPETLSNNLCSLKPKVDRLVMVCEMTIHPTGRITSSRFYEGVIQSRARLTYNQVHAAIEKKDRKARENLKEVLDQLTDLYDLFKVLHKARRARGAIDFDMPETKIVYGKNRKIEKIVPYERFNSHRVIEECMLCANISAALYLSKNKHPSLYRVHEGPNAEKLNDLRQFLNEMGLKMPGHRDPVPADYAHILRTTAERSDSHMIQTILLRSMSQAIYDPFNKGHFGLAYEAYTHFTSPIRRYPDLLVHRALKELIKKKQSTFDERALVKAGEHCSMTERRADDATEEAIDWLKCEFMLDKVGKEYKGTISGVTNFGIFVELSEVFVEGLVHITNLPSDYYKFDPIKHILTGERARRKFCLGDPVEVVVARVDLDQGRIDFILAENGMKDFKSVQKGKKKESKNKQQPEKKHKERKKTGSRRKKRTS